MKAYLKSLGALAVAALVLTSLPAQAVTITFGGVEPGDGSGLTADVPGIDHDTNTAIDGSGYFIETFDKPISTEDVILSIPGADPDTSTVTIAAGGGFTTLNPFTNLYLIKGSIGIRQGLDPNVAAPPYLDTTFFAYGSGPTHPDGPDATLRVDFTYDMNTYWRGYRISYLGVYYGSIDTYNSIAFYQGANKMISSDSKSILHDDGAVTGPELLALYHGSPGNQFSDLTNLYVNAYFDPNERFTAVELINTQYNALEVDNIVVGLTKVPEPTTMLLLGLGLIGVAGARRKFKK